MLLPVSLQLRTAVHETSHAVLGHMRGQYVCEPGLTATELGTGIAHTRAGFVIPRRQIATQDHPSIDARIEMECAVLLAGYVAERRFCRERARPFVRPWAAPDYQAVTRTLSTYLERHLKPVDEYLVVSAMEDFTRQCLLRRCVWSTITGIANELVKAGGILPEDTVNALLDEALPGPWLPDGRHRDARRRAGRIIPILLRSDPGRQKCHSSDR